MNFVSVKHALRFLERHKDDLCLVYGDPSRKEVQRKIPNFYRNFTKPEYSWARIGMVKNIPTVEVLGNLSICRGWMYETYFQSRKGIDYGRFQSGNVCKEPITCILARSNHTQCVQDGVDFLNLLEEQVGWTETRLFKVPKGNLSILLGSKMWMYNIPLLSAFMLIPRIFSSKPIKDNVTLQQYLDELNVNKEITDEFNGHFSDGASFKMCIENDTLLTLMRRVRHITGKDAYSNNKIGVSAVHSTGIGDFISAIRSVRRDKFFREDIDRCDIFGSSSYTITVHRNLIKRTAQKLDK
jgi:hypothetical protein